MSPDVECLTTTMQTIGMADRSPKTTRDFPLLQLPLALRHQIFSISLHSRKPSAESIYLRREADGSRDKPSPLLFVNKQIRLEVIDLLQRSPITIQVTHQSARFDSLGETCLIAQQRSRSYSEIENFRIEIWPPHPDRPTDIVDIWRHLRKLRKNLLGMSRIKKISISFPNNKMAAWTQNGRVLTLFDPDNQEPSISERGYNDITEIADLFSRVRAENAHFQPPCGLKRDRTSGRCVGLLREAQSMMMGQIPIDGDTYDDESEGQAEYQDDFELVRETVLQLRGAEIARDKLDRMTNHGFYKMHRREFEDFVERWSPKFNKLYPAFKEEKYYRCWSNRLHDETYRPYRPSLRV